MCLSLLPLPLLSSFFPLDGGSGGEGEELGSLLANRVATYIYGKSGLPIPSVY